MSVTRLNELLEVSDAFLSMEVVVTLGIAMIPFEARSLTFLGQSFMERSHVFYVEYTLHHTCITMLVTKWFALFTSCPIEDSNKTFPPNTDPQNVEKGKFIGYMGRVICKLISLLTK